MVDSLDLMSLAKVSSSNKDPLENRAWRNLADAYKTVYSYIMSDLRQYGLTPPQYTVLRIIRSSPSKNLSMSEIGKEMIVTFANITTIVDNLEKLQYVRRQREPEDRRLVKVELTDSGSRLYRKIYPSHRREVARLMKVLEKEQLQQLIDYTDALKKNTSLLVASSKKAAEQKP